MLDSPLGGDEGACIMQMPPFCNALVSHKKSSIERGIGTSPRVGGLRGSSATGRDWCTVEKNEDRGYPKVRGGKIVLSIG